MTTQPPTPRRITFQVPNDVVAVRCIQTLHYQDLVLDAILPALKDSHANNSDTPFPEITQWLDQWSVNELMKFGLVQLYHLWERQMKSLYLEQMQVARLPAPKGESATAWLLRLFADHLSAPTAQNYRDLLEECRSLANTLKHDVDQNYEELEKLYPRHFEQGPSAAVERFRITPEVLGELYDGIRDFWEAMPRYPKN